MKDCGSVSKIEWMDGFFAGLRRKKSYTQILLSPAVLDGNCTPRFLYTRTKSPMWKNFHVLSHHHHQIGIGRWPSTIIRAIESRARFISGNAIGVEIVLALVSSQASIFYHHRTVSRKKNTKNAPDPKRSEASQQTDISNKRLYPPPTSPAPYRPLFFPRCQAR